MIADLLEKWVELEPEKCWRNDDEWVIGSYWIGPQADGGQLAQLQRAVQEAIVAHDLRFRLENSEREYNASLVDINLGGYTTANDPDPAIAMLKNYVAWLEKRAAETTARRD